MLTSQAIVANIQATIVARLAVLADLRRRFPAALDGDDRDADEGTLAWLREGMLDTITERGYLARVIAGEDVEAVLDDWCPSSARDLV